MSSQAFVNPWKSSIPTSAERYLDWLDGALSGQVLPSIEADSGILPGTVAKTILFGAALAAPLLVRPPKAEASPGPVDTGPKVVIVGDSLSVGLKKTDAPQTYAEAGLNTIAFSAYGGRRMVFPGCEVVPITPECVEFSDGLREVRGNSQSIDEAQFVRLGLGTNDSIKTIENDTRRVLDAVFEEGSKDGNPPIVILPEIFGTAQNVRGQEKNAIFHALAKEYTKKGLQVIVPPYAEQVSQVIAPAGGLSSDGIHLTPGGYRALAQYDVEVLKSLPVVPDSVPIGPTRDAGQSIQPSPTSVPLQPAGNTTQTLVDSFSAPINPTTIQNMRVSTDTTQFFATKPTMSLDLIPFEAIEFRKKSLAQTFQATPTMQPNQTQYVSEVAMPLPQEVMHVSPLANPPIKSINPSTETMTQNQLILEKASQAGIFYEPTTGRAMTYVKSFFDPSVEPEPTMVQGFGDFRDLPQTGPYLHGNTDWHAAEGSPFVSSVPAKVIRYDDPNPGQKKGVGNALVLLMGLDENGQRIAIQSTHFSGMVVNTDDIVMPGQLLAYAGHTGITTGPHFSVGMTNKSLQPYTNRANSLDPTLYYNFNYMCAPDALDDPEEVCLKSDTPLAVPIHEDVLAYLGIPEYLFIDLVDNNTFSPEAADETNGLVDAFAGPIDAAGVVQLPDISSETNELEPTDVLHDETLVEEPSNKPPTFVDQIDPVMPNDAPGLIPEVPSVDETLSDIPEKDDTTEVQETEPNTVDTPPETIEPPTTTPPPPPTPPVTIETIGTNSLLTYDDVAQVLPHAERENILLYTPLLVAALEEQGIADDQMICYSLATIQVESSGMKSIPEYGRGEGHEYGVPDPITGQTYYGRGLIQLTWKGNYEKYGAALGIDLVNNPDLALEPATASRILALYMKYHEGGIRETLNAGDLKGARQIVNGRAAHGLEGFSASYGICQALLSQKQG